MNIKETWKNNPVLVLVLVAFVISLLVLVWSWVQSFFNYFSSTVKSIGSTISTDQAQAIANSIYSEVNSMFTDEDVIVQKLIPLTLADYFKVKAAFGLQPYNTTLDEFGSLTGENMNLTQVLNLTLHENDKEKLRKANPKLPIG